MAAPQHTSRYRDAVLSRTHVEALIAAGRKIVIVDGRVLKTDAWLPFHPGGDKAILHMVGRDATNEVKAFHSTETQQLMFKYQIGTIEGQWRDFVPPIQGGVFRKAEEQKPEQPRVEDVQDDLQDDSSEQGSSQQPSPLFDPAERPLSSLRRRRGSNAGASDSSATSLSDLELEEPTLPSKASTGDDRTLQELQHDLEKYPSLDPATQTEIIEKYKQLDARIRAEGLYNCNYTAYAIEALRYTALALLSYYCLHKGWYALSAVFLGMLWQQLVFTVHDAGHMGITHDFQTDSCIGIFIADFLGGLSCCWWKRNHNVHHIVTNSAEHDPDIQHMPFFAVSHRFFDGLRSTYYDRVMTFDPVAKFMLQYQHYMYYPILTFGRFNLYVLSWQYIILGQGPRKGIAWWHRYLEAVGQVFFWYWFGYLTVYKSIPTGWDRFVFVMISHMVTMPVHVQITLSHFAMSTSDLGVAESFPQRMLRTTMDVDCPEWLDFFHGGLQFQAVHHLFPRIPRHNLRRCQKLAMEFCQDVGIPYAVYGFAEGNGKVIGHLGEVAKQARMMAECGKSMGPQDVFEAH
ncbi:hypothetical protein LTR85_009956 [Meristemomyces frigidus]|nr:hypothetical protein LTR85_009956 [Meristemomyces frigidus]